MMEKLVKGRCVRFFILCFAFLLMIGVSHPAQAKTMKLSHTEVSVTVGSSKKITVKNTKKKAKWSSSNKKIATVDKAGKITGKKAGKANVTATIGKKKLICKVTVKNKKNGEHFSCENSLDLKVGNTETVTLYNRSGHPVKSKITWKSSNPKIVSVKKITSTKAKLKALKGGATTVTAKYRGNSYKLKVNVRYNSKYYEKRRAQILKEAGIKKDMAPQYVCFLLAKWICDHVEYSDKCAEMVYKNEGSIWETGQTYEQALDSGIAVCGGYSDLYTFLLKGTKIPVKTIIGEGHAWNHVKINGKWYAIDVTCMDQDDSIPDCGEGIRYDFTNFLMPDKMLTFSYGKSYGATSTRFVKTIYEELLVYCEKNPDNYPCSLDYYDKNGKFTGRLGDFHGIDYRYSPWFTGTWVNY